MKNDKDVQKQLPSIEDNSRRSLLGKLVAAGSGLFAFSLATKTVAEEVKEDNELRFPDDPPEHRVV